MDLGFLSVPEIGECSNTYGNTLKRHIGPLEVILPGQVWDHVTPERISRIRNYNTLNKKGSMSPRRKKEEETLVYRKIPNNK